MDNDRMRERGINFTSRQFAKLEDYKLVFNKKAKGGDFGYANIEKSEGDYVEGALYDFPDNEISKLDSVEGSPFHYNKINVVVTNQSNNSINAITYIAHPDKIVNGLLPTSDYLKHLLAGQDILTPSYYSKLCKVKTL